VAEQLGVAIESARLRERAATAAALEERQRLARDLHDSVTQLLYSQVLFADAAIKAQQAGEETATQHYLARLREAAHRAVREMRLLIYRLRPSLLAQLGLVGALQRRLELVEERAGIHVHFTRAAVDPVLAPDTEKTLYYIVEEALNNALKHAAATEVWVEMALEAGRVCLRVADNGVGFDVAQVITGVGLQSLRERAASCGGAVTVMAEPGEGTRIEVCLPMFPN
jgi:signal transduction histidine kinase